MACLDFITLDSFQDYQQEVNYSSFVFIPNDLFGKSQFVGKSVETVAEKTPLPEGNWDSTLFWSIT